MAKAKPTRVGMGAFGNVVTVVIGPFRTFVSGECKSDYQMIVPGANQIRSDDAARKSDTNG